MSENNSTNGAPTTPIPPRRHEPRGDEEDVIRVGPFHAAVIADQNWAAQRYRDGAFNDSLGLWIAVVDKEVQGKGDHVADLRKQVCADNPGLIPARVALFYADPGDF